MKWVQSVSEATLGDVVAINRKTLGRSHNHRDGIPAIHMVSAWSRENGLVLGQEKTAEKVMKLQPSCDTKSSDEVFYIQGSEIKPAVPSAVSYLTMRYRQLQGVKRQGQCSRGYFP